MNAPINLNDKFCAFNCEINHKTTNRVLAPDRVTVTAKLAQGLPSDVLRGIGLLAEPSGAIDFGVSGHQV